jgi:glycosyltransferase involved in cell wall biosynthesis
MDNTVPKVSVIIPNYNHERYLQHRIDSVLNQSFDDFEVIILDDYSSDNSRQVIETYRRHPKVTHVVFNDINSGSTFKQWNKGIALAKGEWIWFAESDDWCEPELLATLLKNASKSSNTTISYCQSHYREEGSDVVLDMSFHTESLSKTYWLTDYINTGVDEIKNFLLYKNTIPNASAVIFKKSAFIQVDKAFERMRLCGDWMLWVQLLKIGNIAFCAKPLNSFRAHNSTTRVLNTLAKKRLRLEEEYRIVLDIKKTYKCLAVETDERMQAILEEYNFCFDDNKHIIFPYLYGGKIPYLELLAYKVKRLFK